MPRVDVFVRVRNDVGEDTAVSDFSIGPEIINELQVDPGELARYLIGIFRDTAILAPSIVDIASDHQDAVTPIRSWSVDRISGGSLRDVLRRLDVADRPQSASLREVLRRQLSAGPMLPGVGMVDLPESRQPIDLQRYAQALRHDIPEVTINDIRRCIEMLRSQETDPNARAETPSFPVEFEGQFVSDEGQFIPEPSMERLSSQLRERASRTAAVRRASLEAIAAQLRGDTPHPDVIEEARSVAAEARFQPEPPPRGRTQHAVIFDDVAHFPGDTPTEEESPRREGWIDLHSEVPISQLQLPDRNSMRLEAFRQAYGGARALTSGIEPVPSPTGRIIGSRARVAQNEGRVARPSVPKPPAIPEDRTAIPTRYQRKPVI